MSGALAPGFLLASPPLGDPNFERTVVLLAAHGEEGALGFVVNRRAQLRLGQVLGLAGLDADDACEACPIYLGGPVQPSSGWVLGRDLVAPDGTSLLAIGPRVRVTRSKRVFEDLAEEVRAHPPDRADPKQRIVILGYSGWGPGQLEREIGAGAWLPTAFEESVVFDVDPAERWERAYELLGIAPAGLMSMRNVGQA